MIHDDELHVETDEDIDIDFTADNDPLTYENWQERIDRTNATIEAKARRAKAKAEDDERRAKHWAEVGGDIEAAGYKLSPGVVFGIQMVFDGRVVAHFTNFEDAQRLGNILKLHVPLITALQTAVQAIKAFAPNQPEVMKVYIETNRFVEMLKAKETSGQPVK